LRLAEPDYIFGDATKMSKVSPHMSKPYAIAVRNCLQFCIEVSDCAAMTSPIDVLV